MADHSASPGQWLLIKVLSLLHHQLLLFISVPNYGIFQIQLNYKGYCGKVFPDSVEEKDLGNL